MKLLAWDTSSTTGCLGALTWNSQEQKVVAEIALNVEAKHSEKLLWSIHQALNAARWSLSDLDYIGVGVGPGSFTGIRIGVTTARTLAYALNKPLVGFSSLALLARPTASFLKQNTLIIVCVDACKGEVFALYGKASSILDCVYSSQADEASLWGRGVKEEVIEPIKLAKKINYLWKTRAFTSWIAYGNGIVNYPEIIAGLPLSKKIELPACVNLNTPKGSLAAWLTWEAIQAGVLHTGMDLLPRYLRASDAEIKLLKGLIPCQPTGLL